MSEFFKKPDLSGHFPKTVDDLKLNMDLNNRIHGPHIDVLQAIKGGTDQARISEKGDVIGGTTNFGKVKIPW